MPSKLIRLRPIYLLAVGAFGGAAYRFSNPPFLPSETLNPHTFTPYTLVGKQRVSSTSAVFTLRNSDGAPEPESVREAWQRSVWSLQIKQPQLQIARAYTPLPPIFDESATQEQENGYGQDIRLLIRQEEGGEMSTYLHRLPEGSAIELRGPTVECVLPDDVKEVVFLAGGTGVAPAMQLAQVLGRRTGSKMYLLWANRRRDECTGGVSDEASISGTRHSWWKHIVGVGQPSTREKLVDNRSFHSKGFIVQELEAFKQRSRAIPEGFEVQYFVDEEKTFIKPGDVAKRLLVEGPEGGGSRMIFISGPEGFIEYWAGKKIWSGGREVQGPLGGVLGNMDLKDWKVYKL